MASKRRYVTQSQLEEYSNITITDSDEADDQISIAEEMIDAYVGRQRRHVENEFIGTATGGTTTTIVDTSNNSDLNDFEDDYYNYCRVKVVGGTNSGEERSITAYDKSASTITVDTAFSSAIDSTSVYRIYQLSKFPRNKDAKKIDENDTWYKWIPEEVTRATLAQVEFIIEKGLDYFAGAVDYESEDLGDYAYKLGKRSDKLIAPVARKLLRGFVNRTGRLIA